MGLRTYLGQLKSSRILLLVLGLQVALIVVRTLNLYVTGFQTSDETNYILDVMVGERYGTRYFFYYQLALLFKLFSIDSIPRFLFFFPFYLLVWTFAFLILAYKTVSLVTQCRYVRDFVLFSLPFVISYSVLSVGLLSEGPGLTMSMLGIYAWLRYVKVQSKWYLVALSGAAFVAAMFCREPYEIFPLMGAVAWVALALTKKVPLRHMMIFVAVALAIAVPAGLFFGTPGVVDGIPGYVLQANQVSTSATIITRTVTTTSVFTTAVISGATTVTTTMTSTYTSVVSSAIPTTESPAPQGLAAHWAGIFANSMLLFSVGMVLGWGPILIVAWVASFIVLLRIRPRREIPWLRLYLALLSLGTFFGAAIFFSNQSHFYLTQGLSNLIRLTNTTIPGYLLLSPILYEKLNERRIKVLAVILIALTAGSAGFYVSAVQTNFQLPYNVLDFRHVNSPLEARNYLLQNASAGAPTIVFLNAGWESGELYLRDIPGIVIYPSIRGFNYPEITNMNYTSELFLRLRPTTFYAFSANPLSVWNANAPLGSNVLRVMAYESVFLDKTYSKLFHADTSPYGSTPYTIDSVQVVFSSPTGHLLKVHVSWSASRA